MTRMNIRYGNDAGPRCAGLISALALHAVAIATVLSHPPARSAIAATMPIMVSLITSAPTTEPKTPPRPLPVRPPVEPTRSKPIEPLPLVATTSETSAQFVAPPPAVRELPAIGAPPRQADSAPSAAASSAPVLPRFDAAYLQNPPPVYPPLARRMAEQGRVLLRVLVTQNGAAERVELRTSSGSARLDHAALDTVKRWRFVPALQGDRPVDAWVLVPISFSLEG